jgi:nicotinate-nucleotide adenylyltransferase
MDMSGTAMPVGLLGGTFDPPHLGHVALARRAIEALGLERLVVVVVGEAPHKPVETDAETRFRLAEAAFAEIPGVELSRHELDREGPSFTVDTARWAAGRFGDVLFVVGADEFADFPDWREPHAILDAVRLAVATRPGTDRARLDAAEDRLARPDRIVEFELDPVPIASSDVRERVARGEAVGELVPEPVAQLIDELGLYRATL